MKVGELWHRDDESVWRILKLTRHTPARDSKEEGVEVECIGYLENRRPKTGEEKMLEAIFGARNRIGEFDVYERSIFIQLFKKIYK